MSHVNIHHPHRDMEYDHLHRENAKLRAELEHERNRVRRLESDLASIFDRLEQGADIELYITPDKMMRVTTYERVGRGWREAE
jgi:hypothetical protein